MKTVQVTNGKQAPRVVKLRRDVYDKLHVLVSSIALKGWQHFGAKRDERATMSSVIEEAIDQMVRRAEKAK